mmetsp:Transcript_3135/g.4847  ORF Transcript_3135/g.4847 Transcript_3135/m.4847 type:complete len:368 (-) Transcript_3135:35-1138(-)
MGRGQLHELCSERALMEWTENAIIDIQRILRDKVGETHAVIEKAMDIEDYLYREALYENNEKSNGNVWESIDAISTYTQSIHSIKKVMQAREGDWKKLFDISDIKQFIYQLSHSRQNTKRRVSESASSNYVPPPRSMETTGNRSRSTKKPGGSGRTQAGGKKKSSARNRGVGAVSVPAPPPVPAVFEPSHSLITENSSLQSSVAPETEERMDLGQFSSDVVDCDEKSMLDGFGLDFCDDFDLSGADLGEGNESLPNAAAWGLGEGDEDQANMKMAGGATWEGAAEEKREQQMRSAGLEQQRHSQQEELRRLRNRDMEAAMSRQQQDVEGENDIEEQRLREKRKREAESQHVYLDRDRDVLADMDWDF